MIPPTTRRIASALLITGVASLLVFAGGMLRSSDRLSITRLKAEMPVWEIPAGMDRYDIKLRHVFAEAYAPEVELRCLITGGMWETVLFLRDDELVTLVTSPASSVWSHELLELALDGELGQIDPHGRRLSHEEVVRGYANTSPHLSRYPIRRKTTRINRDTRDALKAVWLDALRHARRDQRWMGLDGGTYTYSLRTPTGDMLAGSIWSPRDGTARALCNVASDAADVSALSRHDSVPDHLAISVAAYWDAAAKRTSQSMELEHHDSDLGRRAMTP